MAEERPAGYKSALKGPQTISVSLSGTHATGGYTHQNLRAGELPPVEKASPTTGEVAAPDRPHVGPSEESER